MAFPTPGGDFNTWGTKLIGALRRTLTEDGDIRPEIISDISSDVADQVQIEVGDAVENAAAQIAPSLVTSLVADAIADDETLVQAAAAAVDDALADNETLADVAPVASGGDPGTERQTLRVSGGVPRWRDEPNFFGRDRLSGHYSEDASPGLAQLVEDMQEGIGGVGVYGGNLQLEEGEYRLTETLDLDRFTGRIGGNGPGVSPQYQNGSGRGTVIRWDGPADEPVFRVHNSAQVTFENFRIEGNDNALASYGIEFIAHGGEGAGTNGHLIMRDLWIGRYAWTRQGVNKGLLKRGIGFTGHNTNNDQFRIERVVVNWPTEYGLYVPNSQSVSGYALGFMVSNPGIAGVVIGASSRFFAPELYSCPVAIDVVSQNCSIQVHDIYSEHCDTFLRTSSRGLVSLDGGLIQVGDTIAGSGVFIDASPSTYLDLSLENIRLTQNTDPANARIEIGTDATLAGLFDIYVRGCQDMSKEQIVFASGAGMGHASSKGSIEWQTQYGTELHKFRNELRNAAHPLIGSGARTTIDKTVWDLPITD